MSHRIAGIDVHKRMLAVVVADSASEGELQFERRKFLSGPGELRKLAQWLDQLQVQEAVIAYASHCTSLGRCDSFSTCKSLFDNLTPLALCGGLGPGCS